jgi:hypothetical protein
MLGEKRLVREAECSPPTSTTVGTNSLDSSVRFHGVLRENALDLLYPSGIPIYYLTFCDESVFDNS